MIKPILLLNVISYFKSIFLNRFCPFVLCIVIQFSFFENTNAQVFPNPASLSTGQGLPNTIDPIWQASAWYSTYPPNPMGLAYIPTLINNNCAPGAWVDPASLPAPVNNGNWITGSDDDCATNTNEGYRYFRLTLNLPPDCNGYSVTVPGNYVLDLVGYVDNTISDVLINGNSMGISGGSYSAGSQLNIHLVGPWVAGTNYVDILVYNFPQPTPGINPYGLLMVANATSSAGLDTDGDGISNLDDLCPCQPGNNSVGCLDPVTNGCDLQAIRNAFTAAGCVELNGCANSCSIYFLNPSSLSGSAAQAFAQNLGASLISVQSAAENQCVIDKVNDLGYTGVIWIGFNDETTEGTFEWYDQAPVTYTNWAPGEPNNSGDEDCVQIYPGGGNPGTWNDLACNSANAKSIIEVNLCPIINAGSDETICLGSTANLNASNTLYGSFPYTYAWNNGVNVQSNPVSPAVETDYSVVTVDRYSCTATDDVKVSVNPLPTVDAGSDQTICAGGSVTLSGSGATTYTWNNGVTNGTAFNPAATTTYTVTGTDANGCVNTDQVTVTVNPLPTVNAGIDQAICIGGSVTLSGSGATSYVWNNGVTNGTVFNPATTTTYTVTGTDANGCVNTDQVIVTVNSLPTINAGADRAICIGGATTLSGSGATTYTWNNGVTNGTAFNPSSTATYTVTGTDVNGCVNTDQVIVTVNPLPTVNAGTDQTICVGASITLSGSGATTYAWNNGVTNGTAFNPAATTTYTVTGTDANGCVNTDQVTVTVNPLPTVNAGTDQAICIGGSVTLSGSGATSYVWNNGVTNGTAFNPATTTTYTVTGTDANGCVNTDQVIVTVNPLPTVNAGIDQTICINDPVTLSGSGATTYVWDNGITNGTAFNPIATTTYTVNGTDVNGCVNTDQVIVTVNSLPIVNAGADQAICVGGSATLSGAGAVTYVWNNGVSDGVAFNPSATTTYTVTGTDANGCVNTDQLIVSINILLPVNAGADQAICIGEPLTLAGSGAVSYTWDNGVTDGTAFNPAATTTYTVTGTDANGCSNTDEITVTVNPLPAVNAGLDQTICINDPVTLSGSGATTYVWDNGITNGTAFNPTATTTYTVTGTDANGCVNTDQVVVNVNALPIVNAGIDQTICINDPVTLSGSGATTYVWDNGITNGTAFNPTATTTYTVTGTDANGCVNTDQVIVNVNALPIVGAGINQTICINDPVTLSGSGATTYVWDNGITNGTAFNPTTTTTYTVTGTDVDGCVNTDQVTVNVNALPAVNAGIDQTICINDPVTLSGSGATTYVWDNGITNATAFNPTATTTYTVTGTDVNGCVNTDQVIVNVNALPAVDAGIDQTICINDPVTLSGSGAITYVWDNGITNATVFNPIATTMYTVTGTDANGCVNTDQVIVNVNSLPIVNGGIDQTICINDPVTLSGAGAVSYVWDNGITNGTAFNPTTTTAYTVTGTDANGCVNTDQVIVNVNPLPIVDAGIDQTICINDPVTLSGSGATTYVWDNGITNGTAFNPTATTTYTVTGTDVNGCVNTDQVIVNVNALPIVNAGIDQTICINDPVTLSGSGATTYVWDNGITNATVFNLIATTTYTVTGTDANGCVNTDQVIVNVNSLPIVNAGIDQTICINDLVTLSGAGAVSYVWDNGITNGTAFNPTTTINYTVTGTDANGCVNTDQVIVIVNPLPVISFTASDMQGCLPMIITYTSLGNHVNCQWQFGDGTTATGCGSVPKIYTSPGCYDVTMIATSADGCVNQQTMNGIVCIPPNPVASFNTSADNKPLDLIDSKINLFNTSSNADSYAWDFGNGASSTLTSPSHTYSADYSEDYKITLIAYNDLGCSDTAIRVVRVEEALVYYIPNAFTPDGDAFNETFKPIFTSGFEPTDYNLYIYNRWGEIVFESHDVKYGWDGTYLGTSGVIQDGIYTWKIDFKLKASDERKAIVGHVTLMR